MTGRHGQPPEKLHGTEARARRHYRQGEKPCEACRLAYNQAQALRKAQRRAERRAAA